MIFPLAMAFAAATDLLTFKIPNAVSIALVAAFLVIAPFAGFTWNGFFTHLATFAVVLAAGIALFAAGFVGGGDAKLLAAASLWLGYESFPTYLAMVAVCGGVLALVLIVFRRFRLPDSIAALPWVARLHRRDSGMPYGIALAAAALWIYPSTSLFSRMLT